MRVNQAIRAREVRVIDEDGTQLGVFLTREALRVAAERGLDLVEVAPNATPPVCRLMDYGRYKYEQAKQEREARRHQRLVDIKEVKLRPNIDDHDFEVKVRNAERFLREGNKVKCTIMFRGREIVHSSLGLQLLRQLQGRVQDLAVVEQEPRVEGRNMVMFLSPKPSAVKQRTGGAQRAEEESRPGGGGETARAGAE
ncbi:MAG: translation initiation factor IF-3 [Clostridia bacterium]|nr:translation initiation factor IF-3 [Clostridia bacterium]MCL6522311.1 translation initiation factor IF-3 [Bacillota bacterium]